MPELLDVQENLEVYGTPTIPQEDMLPFRLSPIYRRRSDGAFFIPEDDEASDLTSLSPVDAAWVEEQQASGEMLAFKPPLRAQPGCWLLQVKAGAPPELLSPQEGRQRLLDVGRETLKKVEQAIRQRDGARAERLAWYASRALPADPLPLVVLIHLLKQAGLPEAEVAVLERDLKKFQPGECESARRTLARWLQDPPRRSYLDGLVNETGFFQALRWWGLPESQVT